jgi:hypothetical protein
MAEVLPTTGIRVFWSSWALLIFPSMIRVFQRNTNAQIGFLSSRKQRYNQNLLKSIISFTDEPQLEKLPAF